MCYQREKLYGTFIPKYQELITTLSSKLGNGLVEKVLEFAKDGVPSRT